jgi:hypothetical protein
VSIDGKTLRHSFDRATAKTAIHIVSAWASANRLVLGQLKVEEKSNEITAIPALLALLNVTGAVVTIDGAIVKSCVYRAHAASWDPYAVLHSYPVHDLRQLMRRTQPMPALRGALPALQYHRQHRGTGATATRFVGA